MMPKQILTMALVSTLALAACAQNGQGPSNESVGTVIGGIAGGFLGSQFGEGSGKVAVAIAGALAGAWVGSQVAQNMTQKDQIYYDQAATQAKDVPVGETVTWYNPESGNSGSVTPTRVGQSAQGQYCREYQQTITIDGQTERAYGTACQQPDGTWRIVN